MRSVPGPALPQASLCPQTFQPEERLTCWGFLSRFSKCLQTPPPQPRPPPNVCSLTHTETQTHTRAHRYALAYICTHRAHTEVAPNLHTRSHSPVLRGCAGCAGSARKEKARHPDLGAARWRGCRRGSAGGSADLGSRRRPGSRGRVRFPGDCQQPRGLAAQPRPQRPGAPPPRTPPPVAPSRSCQTRLG